MFTSVHDKTLTSNEYLNIIKEHGLAKKHSPILLSFILKLLFYLYQLPPSGPFLKEFSFKIRQ